MMGADPDSRPTVDELLCRRELTENFVTQLWNQWRLFFDVPFLGTKSSRIEEDAVDISCSVGGFY